MFEDNEIISWLYIILIVPFSKLSFNWATNICDALEMPYDLALTIVSAGFRFNLTVVLSIACMVISYYLLKILTNGLSRLMFN